VQTLVQLGVIDCDGEPVEDRTGDRPAGERAAPQSAATRVPADPGGVAARLKPNNGYFGSGTSNHE
jgi:hypothetical protein